MAKAVDSLETHIHTAAFNFQLAAAVAEGETCSSANIPGNAVWLVVLHYVEIQPAGHSAFAYVLALRVNFFPRMQQFAQMGQ